MTITLDPRQYDAVVFDLDGVITDTAALHEAAWRQMFDEFLSSRDRRPGEEHSEFTAGDYQKYVDGKPRYDGVASFLRSRGISLERGDPSDGEDATTICGLGNRKNHYFLQRLGTDHVTVFHSTVALVEELQRHGVGTAVFSSSRNCQPVLEAGGLGDLFVVRVDGVVAAKLGLPGKPDPAALLETAHRLQADPARCVVVEDAEAGVQAGSRGGFALLIGVDRVGHADRLRRAGADVVVRDLSEVGVGPAERPLADVPDALDHWDDVADRLRDRSPALFFDFDGTLSPIVADPAAATPQDGAPAVLARLAEVCPVAIVSGRDLGDVCTRLPLEGVWFAGSHGFELSGPDGQHHEYEAARPALGDLDAAADELRRQLDGVAGVLVERKRFAVAVHYRRVAADDAQRVVGSVRDTAGRHARLRFTPGRKVAELRPDVDWDKGRALLWLLSRIGGDQRRTPLYAGDDVTDEDALRVTRHRGVGIVVRSGERKDDESAAHVAVGGPAELVRVLQRLADDLDARGKS